MNKIIKTFLSLSLMLLIVSCGDGATTSESNPSETETLSITISAGSIEGYRESDNVRFTKNLEIDTIISE